MKTLILILVAVFTAMGLYAGEANKTENPLVKEVAKGIEEKASIPTQRAKNLNEAVERWSNGKASEADKELIKVEDGPFIKRLQDETVYGFQMDVDNPIYHYLSSGSAMILSVMASVIDLYMIQHCTNDLSKITPEDFQKAGASKEYAQLMYMKYGMLGVSKDTYTKYIQAVRAFNCGDEKVFRDYVNVETVDATVVTNYDTQKSAPQIMEFVFKNIKGVDCRVYGEAYKFENGKFGIRVKKQKCGTEPEKEIDGHVWPFIDNAENQVDTTFSALNSGDKVKIFKTK